jgi:predicted ATPase
VVRPARVAPRSGSRPLHDCGQIGAEGDVARHIGDGACLLFLDNFEQIVEAAPDLAALAGECPRLRLLVTSREAMRIAVEREYPLSPLPESPSVELFRRRAGAVAPEIEVEYAAAAAICARLDRLPLAIELAAARCKALSPEQILDRVSESLDLLRGGATTRNPSGRSRNWPTRQAPIPISTK